MPATGQVSTPLDSVKYQNDDAALSDIISGIHDAALDAGRWRDVLSDIAEFVGGQAGVLLSKKPDSAVLNVDHCVGVDGGARDRERSGRRVFAPYGTGRIGCASDQKFPDLDRHRRAGFGTAPAWLVWRPRRTLGTGASRGGAAFC